jgi:5-methyltetrahydropteroyltriglutamate--homocysteine methyltransferase
MTIPTEPIGSIPRPPDRILAAARQLPPDRIGTCDDCGFAPFADDTSTSRDIAFAKIRARVEGTALAAQQLGL